jgi:hypothetical protein
MSLVAAASSIAGVVACCFPPKRHGTKHQRYWYQQVPVPLSKDTTNKKDTFLINFIIIIDSSLIVDSGLFTNQRE